MHRLFREQLDDAVGISEFVIAENIDVRGFSDWSLRVDSAQTALYIKKLYAKLIDKYFLDASFIKPTGDGLLVIRAFDEGELEKVASKAVVDAMEIVEDFHSLVADDMINFPVPRDVGIGIARGSASRLATEERTLDYSGRVLNLASRLMDLARPRGVVIDASYGLNLLGKKEAKQFHEDSAVLKGIAPREPLDVYCWPDEVEVPAWHKTPIGEEHWEHKEVTNTLQTFKDLGFNSYRVELDPPPLAGFQIEWEGSCPPIGPKGERQKGKRYWKPTIRTSEARGTKFAHINLIHLVEKMEEMNVQADWPVTVSISYKIA